MAKIYIPTFGEEVGNTISHGVMSILMLFALPFGVAPFDKPCRSITLRSDCLLSIKR